MVAMQAQMKPIIAVTGKGRNDMARCKDCIHDKVCDEWAVTSGIPFVNSETCEHFTPTADVVPKSEVLEIFSEIDSMISLVSAMIGLDIIAFGKYAELKKKHTEVE